MSSNTNNTSTNTSINTSSSSSAQYYENRQAPPASSEWSKPYMPSAQNEPTVHISVQNYENRQAPTSSEWSKPYMP